MSRVLIKDKASESKAVQKKDLKAVKEQLKITKSYGDALKMFLEPGRKPPRKIPHDESFSEIVQTSSAVKLESQDSLSSGTIHLSSL